MKYFANLPSNSLPNNIFNNRFIKVCSIMYSKVEVQLLWETPKIFCSSEGTNDNKRILCISGVFSSQDVFSRSSGSLS